MTNPSDERLSALLDGELDGQERQAALDKLLDSEHQRKAWGRYHLIGDTLKRSLPGGIDHGFSSRVMAALADEPTVLAPPVRAPWGQRLAGLAVAASVAAVAVLGVQFMYQQDAQAPAQQLAKLPANGGAAPAAPLSQQNIARAAIPHPTIQPSMQARIQTVTQTSGIKRIPKTPMQRFHPRLNKYLIDHNQQAAGASMQGMIPYARIVAYPNSHLIQLPAKK
ncbi:MAG TPA: hypothetical protein ENI97_02015 [Gammaproteobacteria bacterium]|nr:hypothetical protein [Gammaproteobacteria bacterium]